MVKISANLGFLWTELPLPQRIERAAAAGFAAVEVHFPYDHDAQEIAALLRHHELHLVGLNTGPGGPDDFGVAAVPGREVEAIELIDQAIDYAATCDASYVSVIAGRVSGDEADQTFRQNLGYACAQAVAHGLNIVIEPLSVGAVPGYFLNTVEQAVSIIDAVNASNLRLMIDCFHTQTDQGELAERIRRYASLLGHVQIASVPDRAEPDTGEIDYSTVLSLLDEIGYQGWVGAEYHPKNGVEGGLGWLREMT